jgi:heat shock protein HslJ
MFKSRAGSVLACVLALAACHSTSTRPVTAAQLAGSRWTALLIDEGGVRSRPGPTLEFLDDVKVAGYGGCNGYHGKVHVSRTSMRLIDVSSTLIGCEDAVLEQERRFMDALAAVRTFRYESGRLVLLDGAGKQRLLLEQDLSEPGPRSASRRAFSVIAPPTPAGTPPYASRADAAVVASPALPSLRNYRLQGLELVTMTDGLGAYFGGHRGALVVQAPAENLFGLKEGDVVLSVNGREPATGEHALRILGSYQARETLHFELMRQQQPISYDITLPP